MAKYAPNRTVPAGFDEELRFFTREVLRAWSSENGAAPDSKAFVLQFAENYFASGGKDALLAARRNAENAAGNGGFPSAEELEARIMAIFIEADKDQDGLLNRKEFKDVMKLFASELGVDMADLRQLMIQADENDDGFIEFREFVPLALHLLQAIFAKQQYAQQAAARASRAADASTQFLLNGMPREDLEAAIKEIFHRADKDSSGVLDRKEFTSALRDSDLGLTKKQIHLLLNEADVNGDGSISYEEFVPVAFGLLTEMLAKQMEYEQLPSDEAAVVDYLVEMFSQYDVDGSGTVPLSQLKQALRDSDIGLSKLQTRALLSEAAVDDAGNVTYREFAKTSAGMIAAILAVAADGDKAARLVEERASGSLGSVNGMDRGRFRDALVGAFAAIDPDGSGRAHLADLRSVLSTDMGLDSKQVSALVNLAREGGLAEDGTADVGFVADFAFDALKQLAELQAMRGY